jgi:hypothetical protein
MVLKNETLLTKADLMPYMWRDQALNYKNADKNYWIGMALTPSPSDGTKM